MPDMGFLLLGGLTVLVAMCLVLVIVILYVIIDPQERRAKKLLLRHLSMEERQQLKRQGYLLVPSGYIPGVSYKIAWRRKLFVYLNGGLIATLCIVPSGGLVLPASDMVLSHLLHLKGGREAAYVCLGTPNVSDQHAWMRILRILAREKSRPSSLVVAS